MTILYTCIVLIIILTCGFINLLSEKNRLQANYDCVNEFRNRFITFSNTYVESSSGFGMFIKNGNLDSTNYRVLIMESNKIQNLLGQLGILAYSAPMGRFTSQNYQVILNTLPKYRDNTLTQMEINTVDDCLMRYLGFTNDRLLKSDKRLRNPFLWFTEGIRYILKTPLLLLNAFGIISERIVLRITGNIIYKVITGIAGLLAVAASIVTILQGKEEALNTFKSLFHIK